MIAEQIPARLVPDVIKNTAVKVTHRLPAADDREAVGATMNATPPQSRYLVTLPPGQAAVFSDGMDFPVLVKVKDGTEREAASPAPTADARTAGQSHPAHGCAPGSDEGVPVERYAHDSADVRRRARAHDRSSR